MRMPSSPIMTLRYLQFIFKIFINDQHELVKFMCFFFLISGKTSPYDSISVPSTISFFYGQVITLKDSTIHLLWSGVDQENKLRIIWRIFISMPKSATWLWGLWTYLLQINDAFTLSGFVFNPHKYALSLRKIQASKFLSPTMSLTLESCHDIQSQSIFPSNSG